MVIFTIDAPHVEHASLARAVEASEDKDEDEAALAGQVPMDGPGIQPGIQGEPGPAQEADREAVDTRYLQFFDSATGLSIGYPRATAEP